MLRNSIRNWGFTKNLFFLNGWHFLQDYGWQYVKNTGMSIYQYKCTHTWQYHYLYNGISACLAKQCALGGSFPGNPSTIKWPIRILVERERKRETETDRDRENTLNPKPEKERVRERTHSVMNSYICIYRYINIYSALSDLHMDRSQSR